MQEYLDLRPGEVLPPPPPLIPPFPGTLIRQGDSGENVRLIQRAINSLVPCYPGRLWRISEDGAFGPGTRDAVMAYQSISGLSADGIVGSITWNRLMNEAALGCETPLPPPPPPIPPYPGTIIRQGATGNNVRLIQQAINSLVPFYPGRLWNLNVDGNFGPNTRDAIMAFQRIFGLPVDGIVGPKTWERLFREATSHGVRTLSTESNIRIGFDMFGYGIKSSTQFVPIIMALLASKMMPRRYF